MANKECNFPTEQANRQLNGTEYTRQAVTNIMELSKMGIPATDEALQDRIDMFFEFCKESKTKPGVETLSLALGTDRVTFWKWCTGRGGKSREWQEACRTARQCISAFVEQATISGHLSPPVGIFVLKNVADWKDTVSFEDVNRDLPDDGVRITAADLPKLGTIDLDDFSDKWETMKKKITEKED